MIVVEVVIARPPSRRVHSLRRSITLMRREFEEPRATLSREFLSAPKQRRSDPATTRFRHDEQIVEQPRAAQAQRREEREELSEAEQRTFRFVLREVDDGLGAGQAFAQELRCGGDVGFTAVEGAIRFEERDEAREILEGGARDDGGRGAGSYATNRGSAARMRSRACPM